MVEISGFLEWDSKFFNEKIAFIEGFKATDNQISEEVERLFQCGFDCIYLYTRRPVRPIVQDIVLADKKRIYILEKPKFKEISYYPDICQPVYKGFPSDLYGLAIQSGEHSRFKVDPHFSNEQFENLYKIWVDNSINKGFADYVLVVADPYPQGFITAKIKNNKICIGLFATDQKHRGKGIGSRLIQEIINEAAKLNVEVEVVTQADNKIACGFYESKGFKIVDEQYVYHIWNPKVKI